MGFWNLGSWSIVGLVLGFLGLLLGEGERGKKKEKERENATGERRKEKEEREKERVVGDGCDNALAKGPTVSANLRTCH